VSQREWGLPKKQLLDLYMGSLLKGLKRATLARTCLALIGFSDILSKTVKCLPEDKPRIMETVWSPLQVIKAFRLGIDVFSSAYPYTLTEKGYALVADYTLPPKSPAARLEVQGLNPHPEGQAFYIDLNNKESFEDFQPVLQNCMCYTCANFTRSYIHHLLNTSELLSYVLLTIHNFHQYFEFFHHLRRAVLEDRLDELENSLVQQSGSADKWSSVAFMSNIFTVWIILISWNVEIKCIDFVMKSEGWIKTFLCVCPVVLTATLRTSTSIYQERQGYGWLS